MEYKNLALLSDEKRKGLLGELCYLIEILEKRKKTKEEVLNGWVGPDYADQDFVYDGIWREIKTTGLSSDQISIHSLEQLGIQKENGELHVYRIDPCAPEMNGATTLRKTVNCVVSFIGDENDVLEKFTSKLNAVGYIDMEVYDKFFYKVAGKDVYEVDDTFPRLIRDEVRPEIVKCEYNLSLSGIKNWKKG